MPNRIGLTVCYGSLAISMQKPPSSKTLGRQARHPKYCCVITRDRRVSPLSQHPAEMYNVVIAQPRYTDCKLHGSYVRYVLIIYKCNLNIYNVCCCFLQYTNQDTVLSSCQRELCFPIYTYNTISLFYLFKIQFSYMKLYIYNTSCNCTHFHFLFTSAAMLLTLVSFHIERPI